MVSGILVALVIGLEVYARATSAEAEARRRYHEGHVFQAYGRYMANEHPVRGAAFAEVATALESFLSYGYAVDREHLTRLLGAPDLVYAFAGPDQDVGYLYDRFGKKDWMIVVVLSGDTVTNIHPYRCTPSDMSRFKPCTAWAGPDVPER